MRDAAAPHNSDPDEPAPKTSRQVVPLDLEAILRFKTESDTAGDTSEGNESARVTPFPTVVHQPEPTVEFAAEPVVPAAAAPTAPNWRNAIAPVLAAIVLAQGAFLVYSTMSRRSAAPPVTDGRVTITSEPAGSPVMIDGSARGQTPLGIALKPGAHKILVGAGALARSQAVTVTAGGEASVHVQLPPASAVVAAAVPVGALQITTDPPGARVAVDGKPRGTTPSLIQDLAAGDHTVTVVRAEGGDALRRTVKVQEGATASLIIAMPGAGAFASGWLTVSSAVPLQVMEKDQLLGTTEVPRILLPAGEHQLELVNASLDFRAARNVTIVAGRTATFAVGVPQGALSINAMPWATVWIDGQPAGETPIGNYSIPIGTHELLFRNPEFGEQRKTVVVGAQKPVRVGIDMKKP